jgi:hypothetical protein
MTEHHGRRPNLPIGVAKFDDQVQWRTHVLFAYFVKRWTRHNN